MSKSLLYRIFGAGKFSHEIISQLESESLTLIDEGIKASVTFKNFKSPGRRSSWRRNFFTASIALTGTRLFAQAFSKKIIDVPLTDERIQLINFDLMPKGGLLLTFDAGLFQEKWSGTIEYRFHTELAKDFYDKLA